MSSIIEKSRAKSQHTYSQKLPILSKTTSKLFQTKEDMIKTRKILLEKINLKQPQQHEKSENIMRRSFIQFPKSMDNNSGFTSFLSINKSQSDTMMSDFPKLRSQSTQLNKCFVKAQMVYNKFQASKIQNILGQKQKKEHQLILKRIKQLTPSIMKKQVTIKPKFKTKLKKVIGIKLAMNFQIYENNLQIWKPFLDFDAMPVFFDGMVYFIGGRKKDTPLVCYSVLKNKWMELPEIKGLKPFGECTYTLLNDKRLAFFGGYNYFQQGFSLINNTLKIIDFQNHSIEELQFDEKKVPPRSFHDQCIYGKYLIISGGLNKDSKCFNNFMTYQIDKNYWNQLTINQIPNDLSKGFAKHQTLPIFHKRKVYSIYNQEDIVQIDPEIKQEGIYMFGGQNFSGQLIDKMFIVKLGSPSVNIVSAKIQGKPPIARRNMKMIREGPFIIIHGGRNDEMKPFALNSMHFLNLKTLNWIQVQGQSPPFRFSHSLSVIKGNIVILGGKTHEGLSKEVFIMPFDEITQFI